MVDNIVEISALCPLKFKDADYTPAAPYNSRYFEDHHFSETLPYYLPADEYKQIFQKNDIIFVQVRSNYAPLQLSLYNAFGALVGDFVLDYTPTSTEATGLKVYQASVALNTLLEGKYKFQLKCGSPLINILETDWICIKEKHEGSILFEYKHEENDFNTVFETGVQFRFRVHGGFKEFQPQSERTVFIDQPGNIVQLTGKSFYTKKLVIGNTYGVPEWVIHRINEIMLCSEVLIDGKQWVGVSGAKFDPTRQENYTRAGWSIEVRPAKGRSGNRFVDAGPAGTSQYYVIDNAESNLFGMFNGPASSNIIQIQETDQ